MLILQEESPTLMAEAGLSIILGIVRVDLLPADAMARRLTPLSLV
jgi:hypothetical protein